MNKKGIAFEWLYALIFLFLLGILFIVYNEVLSENIYPISVDLVPDDFEGKSEIVDDNNKFMQYWLLVPVISFVIVIVYLIVNSIGSGD